MSLHRLCHIFRCSSVSRRDSLMLSSPPSTEHNGCRTFAFKLSQINSKDRRYSMSRISFIALSLRSCHWTCPWNWQAQPSRAKSIGSIAATLGGPIATPKSTEAPSNSYTLSEICKTQSRSTGSSEFENGVWTGRFIGLNSQDVQIRYRAR